MYNLYGYLFIIAGALMIVLCGGKLLLQILGVIVGVMLLNHGVNIISPNKSNVFTAQFFSRDRFDSSNKF